MRYSDNAFSTRFINTIGVELVRNRQKSKTIEISGKTVRLQLWDTAGQESKGKVGFRTLTSSYYRGSHGIAIVFDITDRTSFQNVTSWLAEIERYPSPSFASTDVLRIVVGNKLDLEDRRLVTTAEAKALAQSHGLAYFETSAKDSAGVAAVFETLARAILQNEEERCIQPRNSFILSDVSLGDRALQEAKTKRRKCCRSS